MPLVLANVSVPDTQAPTFLSVSYTKDTSRLAEGVFSLALALELDEAANVTYVVYKQFDCVQEPSLFEALTGAATSSTCQRSSLTLPVAHGQFEVASSGPASVTLPDIQLSPVDLDTGYCFQGSLDKVWHTCSWQSSAHSLRRPQPLRAANSPQYCGVAIITALILFIYYHY